MFLNKNAMLEDSDEQPENNSKPMNKPDAAPKPVREQQSNEGFKFSSNQTTNSSATSGIKSRHIQGPAPSSNSSMGVSMTKSNGPNFSNMNSSSTSNNFSKPGAPVNDQPKQTNTMMVFSSSEDEDQNKADSPQNIKQSTNSFQNNSSSNSYNGNSNSTYGQGSKFADEQAAPNNEENFRPMLGNAPSSNFQQSNSMSYSSARPGTGSQRLQQLEQQKRKLQEKLKMQEISSSVKRNENFKPNLGEGESRYGNDDIDYENLEQIVKEKPNIVYQPGKSKMTSQATFVPLTKTNEKIKYVENEVDESLVVSEVQSVDNSMLGKKPLNGNSSQSHTPPPPPPSKDKQKEESQDEQQDEDNQKDEDDDEEEEEKEKEQDDDDQDEDDEQENEEELRKQLEQMKKNQENQLHEAKVELSQQPEESQSDAQKAELNQQSSLPQIIQYNEIPDMKAFLTNPVPKGIIVQTTIKRDQSGFARFYPQYHCYLSNSLKQIISGKKRSANNTSNYLMCMNPNDLSTSSPGYLGQVRSNFLGTEFRIYDTGENPSKAKTFNKIRKELGGILYQSNLLGARGPRKIRVLIPSMKDTGEAIEWKPLKEKDGLIEQYKSGSTDGLYFYRNKPPKWNDIAGAFVLNFNGRVTKPSVKNFQLIDDVNQDLIYLQFGRVQDEHFNLDFQYPLSPLQAFGIALSSFDYKIACE